MTLFLLNFRMYSPREKWILLFFHILYLILGLIRCLDSCPLIRKYILYCKLIILADVNCLDNLLTYNLLFGVIKEIPKHLFFKCYFKSEIFLKIWYKYPFRLLVFTYNIIKIGREVLLLWVTKNTGTRKRIQRKFLLKRKKRKVSTKVLVQR